MAKVERSGLVVPVVLWGPEPPKFCISQLAVIQGGSVIVAGSLDGHIIQWKVLDDGQIIQPDMMMLAHEAPVTCLAPTSQSPTSTRYISCCQNGQLCLWNCIDGRCIETMKHPFVHRNIIPYTYHVSSSQSLTRLFCIGDYAEVIVIDAQDLNVLFTLSSRVEPDWINAITIVRTQALHDVVIGVSISGMIKLWSLRDISKKDALNVIYEDESKVMSVKNVRAVSCSTLNTRIMLLVSASSWQIVDTCNLNQLIISECAIDAVDGTIIDVDKIAVGFVDSTIVLFQLPRNRLTGKQIQEKYSQSNSTLANVDQPFVFALLKGFNPSPHTFFTSSVRFFFETQTRGEGNIQRVAYRADSNGHIAVWKIPHNFDPLVEEFLRSKRPIIYEPTLDQSLDKVWAKVKSSLPAIYNTEDRQITATIYISNQGKLLLGCHDGKIVMMNACRAIMSQLLDYIPADPIQHRILNAHLSAVTCFMYPFEESSRYDPNILISGGKDFSVIAWNLTTGAKLHRFCSQGGAIQRLLIPPDNCNARILHSICSIASDNSAALLSLKENKCILLASRQAFPIVEIKWRPLDDLMMVRCEDDCVYVWQMETANLDRIVTGLVSEDVMEACNEQTGVFDWDDEAGANPAMQMLRALKNKNLAAVKKIATHNDRNLQTKEQGPELLPAPINILQLTKCSNQAHILLFNVDALIMGLLTMDFEVNNGLGFGESRTDPGHGKPSLSSLIAKKHHEPPLNLPKPLSVAQKWQNDTNLYMDTARLLISLIYAWNLDENKDMSTAVAKLRLYKPKVPLHFGTISSKGIISLYMPSVRKTLEKDTSLFHHFARYIHWGLSSALTTVHLIANVALSNSLMSMQSKTWHASGRKSGTLKRAPSIQSTDSAHEQEGQQIKEGWASIAAMHCVMLPDLLKPPCCFISPKVDLLARRWQDSCIDIRDASQALLIRELNRAGTTGRKKLVNAWAPYLPTLLDSSLSIFGKTTLSNVPFAAASNTHPLLVQPMEQTQPSPSIGPPPRPKQPPSRPPPPIPLRNNNASQPQLIDIISTTLHLQQKTDINDSTADMILKDEAIHQHHHHPENIQSGVNQVRRNQATAVVLLGVIGAEFGDDFEQGDIVRATAHSLLELLVAPESPLLPLNSALRRASIDLIGRGFTLWQPHLDISKVLLGLLDLAAVGEKSKTENVHTFGAPLPPVIDASRTARHALSLIATVRSKALITALSMEVARYNSAAQHQTIQHNVVSPLIRSRTEVLRIIEQLTEKQYNDVADLIIPVGDILVHCLDIQLLKQHSLAELFPPIAKFYMIAYCPTSRRIAFGGKNGSIVMHELKTMKSQVYI
jgi:WD40 repeat protein